MKKTMIALALIGMTGTAAAQIQVSPPSIGGGAVTPPSVGGGSVTTPQVGVPPVRTPPVQTPNVGSGTVQAPAVGSGSVTTPGVNPPTVQTPGVNPPSVAVNPPAASTMTEAQARARITASGYTNVKGLRQDTSGNWQGTATINGKSAAVSVDAKGAVSVQQ